MCTLKKKKFLTNSGRKKSAPSQRDPPAKIVIAKFLYQNDSKRLYVVSLHCWRCIFPEDEDMKQDAKQAARPRFGANMCDLERENGFVPPPFFFFVHYPLGDTYRRSLCSKNLKNQARERVRARFFYFFSDR